MQKLNLMKLKPSLEVLYAIQLKMDQAYSAAPAANMVLLYELASKNDFQYSFSYKWLSVTFALFILHSAWEMW